MDAEQTKGFFDHVFKHGWTDLVEPTYWNGEFTHPDPLPKKYKISFCTTVMDRLSDLKLTLPQNIKDNENYENTEFVVLDYNSRVDNVGSWLLQEYENLLKSGKLVYYRTEDPDSYSMAHSRNIAFKLATGDIVNNIDADNYTNPGFALYLNRLAHEQPEKAVFAKGRRMLRGRLGFWKQDFVQLLNGYDEEITGYGHEDHDLLYRAYGLGFTMMWFGGTYYAAVPDHRKHGMENFANKDWRYTEKRNKLICYFNLFYKRFYANKYRVWGKASVVKNFKEAIEV